jgi:hypothetical protein
MMSARALVATDRVTATAIADEAQRTAALLRNSLAIVMESPGIGSLQMSIVIYNQGAVLAG